MSTNSLHVAEFAVAYEPTTSDIIHINCDNITPPIPVDKAVGFISLATVPSLMYTGNGTVQFIFEGESHKMHFKHVDVSRLDKCILTFPRLRFQRTLPLSNLLLDNSFSTVLCTVAVSSDNAVMSVFNVPSSYSKRTASVPTSKSDPNRVFLEAHLHAFSKVTEKGLEDEIIGAVVKDMLANVEAPVSVAAGTESSKQIDERTREVVPDSAIPFMERMFSTLLTDSVTMEVVDIVTYKMTEELTSFLTENIRRSTRTKLLPVLTDSLREALITYISQDLPIALERKVAGRVLVGLGETITHSVVAALSHGLWGIGSETGSENQSKYCTLCYEAGVGCSLCSQSKQVDSTVIYHATYYSDYYSTYYGKYYEGSFNELEKEHHQENEETKS